MNRWLVFLLPILAVTIVGAIIFSKWWTTRTANIPDTGATTQAPLQESGQSLLSKFGMTDDRAIQLDPVDDTKEAVGVVNMSEDNKTATIVADLPVPQGSVYQAWTNDETGEYVKLGTLQPRKGGYILEYSLKEGEVTPLSITISEEKKNDATMESPILEQPRMTEE